MARNSILSSHRQVLRQIFGSNSRSFQTLIPSPPTPTPTPTSSLFSPVPPKPFPSGSSILSGSSRVHFSDLPFSQSRPLSSSSGGIVYPWFTPQGWVQRACLGPSNIVLVNSENDFNSSLSKAQDDSVPAIFYFTAVWCGPCRFIGPIIGELSEKYPHVTTYKIDIDQEGLQSILSKLNITSVPTLHFYQNGKKAAEVIGADVARLTNTIEKLYKTD
ncbi:thioredoxin O2, mitochondrial-like isoform X2 [Quercus lobata]|uniref:thioredoxin O2, mitochondrial-like isoform X2 n=1 Tax=Quercus lobata TaxID=97700 RepID=UPI001245DD7B|nr:thioredoxin O2, mitochondrial-like isoform X2 [Quercus lobata]